jgi:predicted metal-dependent hydrolase
MNRMTLHKTESESSPQLRLWDAHATAAAPTVRFSHRARRVAVRVGERGCVELVVPRGVSEARARAFLHSRADWVAVQVARRKALALPETPFPPQHIHLTAAGESWRVFQAGGKGRPRIGATSSGLLTLEGLGTTLQWRTRLIDWLADRAQALVRPQLDQLATQYDFSYQKLSIRLQRTRWGSCSTRGTICVNLALLFQSPAIVRYLLCHELAHTRHMNHSARFWRCVSDCEPGWQSLDAELNQGWSRVPAWVCQRGKGSE